MNKIYIASSLHNAKRVKSLIHRLESYGAIITYDWTVHGQVFTHEELRTYGEAELKGVLDADILFFLQPGRSGAHVEMGVMLALIHLGYKKSIVYLEENEVEQKTFYHLDCINKFNREDQAMKFILEKIT